MTIVLLHSSSLSLHALLKTEDCGWGTPFLEGVISQNNLQFHVPTLSMEQGSLSLVNEEVIYLQ